MCVRADGAIEPERKGTKAKSANPAEAPTCLSHTQALFTNHLMLIGLRAGLGGAESGQRGRLSLNLEEICYLFTERDSCPLKQKGDTENKLFFSQSARGVCEVTQNVSHSESESTGRNSDEHPKA